MKNMTYESDIRTNNFFYNCGMRELQCSNLLKYNTVDKLRRFFSYYFDTRSGAAVLVSDNENDAPLHKALGELGTYIPLGYNSNSGNTIYCWIISKNSIANYEKRKKSKSIAAEKESKKAVKKLQTTNKKSASKPRTAKRRVAA